MRAGDWLFSWVEDRMVGISDHRCFVQNVCEIASPWRSLIITGSVGYRIGFLVLMGVGSTEINGKDSLCNKGCRIDITCLAQRSKVC